MVATPASDSRPVSRVASAKSGKAGRDGEPSGAGIHDSSSDEEVTMFRIPDVDYPSIATQVLYGIMLAGGALGAVYFAVLLIVLIFARLSYINGLIVFSVLTLCLGAGTFYMYSSWAAKAERLARATSVYIPRLVTTQEAAGEAGLSSTIQGGTGGTASGGSNAGPSGNSRARGQTTDSRRAAQATSQLRKRAKAYL